MTTLITLTGAGLLLGVSAATLRKQVQRGSLHAELIGKTYVVTPAEVERYRTEHLGKHRGGFPARKAR